jgi:uncharacterized peroxidase-related enzyme
MISANGRRREEEMAWIHVIDEDEAGDELRAAYEAVKGSRGRLSNILAVHSLHPKTMMAHMDLYLTIMFGPSGMTREEREMIAVVVSATNRCPYCTRHHAAALDHYWKDEEKLARFIEDCRSVDLPSRMRAILDYAARLTERPIDVEEADVVRLKEEGLRDEEILTVNLVVSYFNFVNRIALGLGVEFGEEEIHVYKY